VAAQPRGKAAPTAPSYLRAAEVADILHVSPKTVSRWAKEGKLPFLKTLGGHRRYPEAEIRQLAEGLRRKRPPKLLSRFVNDATGPLRRRRRVEEAVVPPPDHHDRRPAQWP